MGNNRTPNSQSMRASMELLATIQPDLTDGQRQELFEAVLMDENNDFEAVERQFKMELAVIESGAVFGAAVPPPGRESDIKFFDFDIYRVFYHSTHPPAVANAMFSCNFYIGKSGQGIESITLNAHAVYDIKLLDMTGEWATCYPMNVLPGTRVRLLGSMSQVQELVFPLNPYEISAVIHHLPA
ncbi:hypothetical protein K438DRAFT_1749996 [Mycena galopus ATCC 62051]|nr:hypothetical protein K438DRAFT_1749996 [Mycena galopus ATCC 62051]